MGTVGTWEQAYPLRGLLDNLRGLSLALLGRRRFGTAAPDVLLLAGDEDSDANNSH